MDQHIASHARKQAILRGRAISPLASGNTAEILWNAKADVIRTGRERIAMHGKAQRKYSVLTFPPHHQGIPLAARRAEGKILIHLRQSAPEVEKRSLAAYERLANGGGR
jgi:hypothetical protein